MSDTGRVAPNSILALAQARDAAERRQREKQARRETFKREKYEPARGEWLAAWESLWQAFRPVWSSWNTTRTATSPDDRQQESDIPAAVAALKEISELIPWLDHLNRGEFKLFFSSAYGEAPETLRGRLEWAASTDRLMGPPALAVELVRAAFDSDEHTLAETVRVILSQPDFRPAVGWLPFIRDCLWQESAEPVNPIEGGVSWPAHWRPHFDDQQRLRYLLQPWRRPINLGELFWGDPPRWPSRAELPRNEAAATDPHSRTQPAITPLPAVAAPTTDAASPESQSQESDATLPPYLSNVPLSPSAYAERLCLPKSAVENFLKRFRESSHGCFLEVANCPVNRPKFLYYPLMVEEPLQAWAKNFKRRKPRARKSRN